MINDIKSGGGCSVLAFVVWLLLANIFETLAGNADPVISVSSKEVAPNLFRCEVVISVANGWKLPKAPDISVVKLKNLKNFKYDGNFSQLDESTYMATFEIHVKDRGIKENQLDISIDCPICKDICTIISKDISIILDYKQVQSNSKLFILLFSFIGGLILNIMPCVLPVILMKLKSLQSRQAVLGSIAGNYACFSAFTACIAFLKIAGETIGWGMHFQNPYFLEAVTVILFILLLYSFNIIHFFPSMRINDNNHHCVFFSNFISSIISSIIAIPCTAPFLGTAASFAINGSISDLCLVFFVIATGFSFPYFLLLFIKFDSVSKINIYGWIVVVLKNIVNCGALITFLWLFWLLSSYLNSLSILLHVLLFTALAKRKYIIAIFILSVCFYQLTNSFTKNRDIYENITSQIDYELTKNNIVILNITADWCLTCKYNKHRVLNSEAVVKFIKNNNVKLMEADMTRKSNALMKLINKHDRVGIPFTVVYGPAAQGGIVLNEILTDDAIIRAIKQASLEKSDDLKLILL